MLVVRSDLGVGTCRREGGGEEENLSCSPGPAALLPEAMGTVGYSGHSELSQGVHRDPGL